MLDEITSLELTSVWKGVKKQVRDDPRYLKFGNSDKVSLDICFILHDVKWLKFILI